MNYLPVRPLLKFSSGDGAWMIAQKAEQRKQFKAIICALKAQNDEKIKIIKSQSNDHLKSNIFSKEFIFDCCKTVDAGKVAVINVNMAYLEPSTEEFFEFTSVYKIEAAANYLNLDCFMTFIFLTELNLSSNNLKNISIDPQDFNNLEILDVSFNDLTVNDVLMFGLMKKLKKISLCGNDLNKLPAQMNEPYLDESGHSHYRFTELIELNLEKNNLSSEDTFSSLGGIKKLKILKLAFNKISSIPLLRTVYIEEEESSENMFQLYPYGDYIDDVEEIKFNNYYIENPKVEIRIPSTLLEVDEEYLLSKREDKSFISNRNKDDESETENFKEIIKINEFENRNVQSKKIEGMKGSFENEDKYFDKGSYIREIKGEKDILEYDDKYNNHINEDLANMKEKEETTLSSEECLNLEMEIQNTEKNGEKGVFNKIDEVTERDIAESNEDKIKGVTRNIELEEEYKVIEQSQEAKGEYIENHNLYEKKEETISSMEMKQKVIKDNIIEDESRRDNEEIVTEVGYHQEIAEEGSINKEISIRESKIEDITEEEVSNKMNQDKDINDENINDKERFKQETSMEEENKKNRGSNKREIEKEEMNNESNHNVEISDENTNKKESFKEETSNSKECEVTFDNNAIPVLLEHQELMEDENKSANPSENIEINKEMETEENEDDFINYSNTLTQQPKIMRGKSNYIIEVNKQLKSFTMTEAIKMISIDSQSQNGFKPFPALEMLDLSHNRIKDEKGIIPVISWVSLTRLSINDNPLTLTKSQKSSFIKQLLENAFKMTVDWIPPIVKTNLHTNVSKSKISVSDNLPAFPMPKVRYTSSLLEKELSEITKNIELPKLMPIVNIIKESKNNEENKPLEKYQTPISWKHKSLSDLQRELLDDPEVEVKCRSKTHLLTALKHRLEHPITYFDRNVDLFKKQERIPSKNKIIKPKKIGKKDTYEIIHSVLHEQNTRKVQTEISLETILNPDYFKGNRTREKQFKIASRAINQMQKKYNEIRQQSLKKE